MFTKFSDTCMRKNEKQIRSTSNGTNKEWSKDKFLSIYIYFWGKGDSNTKKIYINFSTMAMRIQTNGRIMWDKLRHLQIDCWQPKTKSLIIMKNKLQNTQSTNKMCWFRLCTPQTKDLQWLNNVQQNKEHEQQQPLPIVFFYDTFKCTKCIIFQLSAVLSRVQKWNEASERKLTNSNKKYK